MNHSPHGSHFEPLDLTDPHSASEALTHWDELDPETLALLAAHPVHGPRLAMLRAADDWLANQAATARAARGECPSADELYDFGRGPGYTPLAPAARAAIEHHLAQCQQCEVLVETLAAPPPVPLELDYDASAQAILAEATDSADSDAITAPDRAGVVRAEGARVEAVRPLDRRRAASVNGSAAEARAGTFEPARAAAGEGSAAAHPAAVLQARPSSSPARLRRWIPVAAAASLLATAALWTALSVSRHAALRFPQDPLLRGATSGSLFFPREHVLHPTPELVRIWPALGERVTFEIQPEPNAQSYWIDVFEHDGSAFGANQRLWKQKSDVASFAAQRELAPGHYTWEAWAIVNGLDQRLGRRDFDVVDDRELDTRLAALKEEPEPARSLAAVRLLHESGYRSDARRIAREMPPSAERDAYLEQLPGR